MKHSLLAFAGFLLTLSCSYSGTPARSSAEAGLVSVSQSATTEGQPGRMLVWKASLSLLVWDPAEAAQVAGALAERHAGYIEQRTDRGETSTRLTLRVPVASFQAAVAGLEALGAVTERTVEAEDVTEKAEGNRVEKIMASHEIGA